MAKTITGTKEDILRQINALLKEYPLDNIISITFQKEDSEKYSATILFRTGK